MGDQPFVVTSDPGIDRDGTMFDTSRYVDALWCRWRRGRPRKMGGYKLITGTLNGLPKRIHCFYNGAQIITHIGTVNSIIQVVFDTNGNFISQADRTPLSFVPGPDVGWTIDALFDTTSSVVQLIAHATPDQRYAANVNKTVPVLGDVTATTRLAVFSDPGAYGGGAWIQPDIAGGIACIQPFVFAYDTNGLVMWSAPNLALYLGVTGGTSGAGQARVSAQKVIYGMPLRGGGAQQPAAIFWTLSEVIVASYVGTPAWFAFSTVSPSSSIISHESVIEYDGLYFWCGVDRFLVFNGTVSELPNSQNKDWFFDNLTPGYEALTFAYKVPRWGEIWWCAAMFGSTVPNYAVVYNVAENYWYDTMLPDGGRSTGYFAQGTRFPIMGDVVNSGTGYGLWMHETGVDKNRAGVLSAIRSYYETAFFGGPRNDPPNDPGLSFSQLEPDFKQTGNLSTYLIGAANANSPEAQSAIVPILANPTVPQEQFASFVLEQPSRLLRLHVESNVIGGNYISGRNLGRGQSSGRRLNT